MERKAHGKGWLVRTNGVQLGVAKSICNYKYLMAMLSYVETECKHSEYGM